MNPSIYIKGIEELERKASKIAKEMASDETQLLLEQARLVRAAIRKQAPRGPTGKLRRSAYAKALPASTSYPTVAFAGIRPKIAPHGHLLEFGTVKMRPHPFFAPAIDSVYSEVMSNIENGLKSAIER
jgi:HK97 gp10 family phage protein